MRDRTSLASHPSLTTMLKLQGMTAPPPGDDGFGQGTKL